MPANRPSNAPAPPGGAIRVYGPAYLDRVLRVGHPLVDSRLGGPIDQSHEGRIEPGEGLRIVDEGGSTLRIEPPAAWPGPMGTIRLARPLVAGAAPWERRIAAASWHDDLGGMGAGFAAALGGRLTCGLGSTDDPMTWAIEALLRAHGVDYEAVRAPDRPADWTLLVTSGLHGDKLPIGFRGCHAGFAAFGDAGSCQVRLVAGLPNRLAAPLLEAPGAAIRGFAPAFRNMADREVPLASFAGSIDYLCCNRTEWEAVDDRELVAARIPLVTITDGPAGCRVRYRGASGTRAELAVPVFRRDEPPRDTNRAGEAFASTVIAGLVGSGWAPDRGLDPGLLERIIRRAMAAAALILDRTGFGFPTNPEVDRALAEGRVRASAAAPPPGR